MQILAAQLIRILVGFNNAAEDVYLSFEGDDNHPILRARLQNVDGNWIEADVNLAERVGNSNGEFSFDG